MQAWKDSYLEESYITVPDVRERLILSGISEVERCGVREFSLRRVAAASGVSCAAPYKHFKDKEDMLHAILGYIDEKWTLLEGHIVGAHRGSESALLIELALANVRFWVGNPHFRAVSLALGGGGAGGIGRAAEELLSALDLRRAYTVRSLVLGAIAMLKDGALENTPQSFEMIRASLADALA